MGLSAGFTPINCVLQSKMTGNLHPIGVGPEPKDLHRGVAATSEFDINTPEILLFQVKKLLVILLARINTSA